MASSSNSINNLTCDSLSELRCDSSVSISAVSETFATRSEVDHHRTHRSQRTVSDATIKRPLRLSNAHRRRVSGASIQTANSNRIAIQSGQLSSRSNTDAFEEGENYSFPVNITPNEYDGSFTVGSDDMCFCCNIPHPPHAHDDEYPEKCWVHQICLPRGGWKKHLEQYEHVTCPLPDCVRSTSKFASREKFLWHWVKRHEEKCWYWGKKKNVFGIEKAVWLRWSGTGS